jgi:hypothetical protein
MATLFVLGMLAFGAVLVLVLVLVLMLALLKLVFVLILLPLRLAFRLVMLPVKLVFGLLILPFALLIAIVCGVGLFAVSIPLLPFALVALFVWLLMRRAPARAAS